MEEHVREFVMDNFLFGWHRWLDDDTSLVQTGVIDGAVVNHLVDFISEAYSIVVQDHEIVPENFDSVRRIVTFIDRKMSRVTVGMTL